MHVERAISNFAILVVGSVTALVAFLSTRLNHVVFYALVAGCAILLIAMASNLKKRLSLRFPGLMGKSIVPRWTMTLGRAKVPARATAAAYRMKTKRQQTLVPSQPQRAEAA
jgi:hypothetical protein